MYNKINMLCDAWVEGERQVAAQGLPAATPHAHQPRRDLSSEAMQASR